jgi:RNA polymerase sigma factor (sigma-70 family)
MVTEYLHRVAASTATRTDSELLARYAASGDDEAFAILLRRHGPMVLGVCCRTLGPTPDADDAFQATFIALSQRAGRIRETLPGWLYRVAVRTSRKALRRSKRAGSGTEAIDRTDSLAAVEWGEVRRVLDDELNRLPTRWRTPLVLCYLEGLTRDEAATQLGWSLRTLHRRLDEGRQRLRERLTKRGLAPALLATLVLTGDLRSEVSAGLLRTTIQLTHATAVPDAIRTLLPHAFSTGGIAMKALVSATVIVAGLGVALSTRQPVAAVQPTRSEPTIALTRAPAPKDRKADDPLFVSANEASDRAAKWLLQNQEKDGTWDKPPITAAISGGFTALALLALLESGTKATDPAIAKAMEYLRNLEPKSVYVVSLQTQVLCAANQKQDSNLIRRNVNWLEKAASHNNAKQLIGWRYTDQPGNDADNSNSRFAVAALYAAHKAGFKVTNANLWTGVRDYYTRTQTKNGGWAYTQFGGAETHTMTAAGALCLKCAVKAIGEEDANAKQALVNANDWLASNFRIECNFTYYNLDVISAFGRVQTTKKFGDGDKSRAWFREGCDWLFQKQKDDGRFTSTSAAEANPVISTAFALRFLASRPD